MDSLLTIITEPSPILHQPAKEVVNFNREITNLIAQMRETMLRHDGIGLAASQIGKPIRLAIIEAKTSGQKNSPKIEIPFSILINPKIISAGGKRVREIEGCLSIPGVEVEVERPGSIEIKFQNETGQRQRLFLDGLFSRIVQHETDHLNGLLITDHGKPIKPEAN